VLKDYEDHKTLLQENIFYNNQAFMELNEDACYEPIGNSTEVGLLKWLQDANYLIPKNYQERYKCERDHISFNNTEKYSLVVI